MQGRATVSTESLMDCLAFRACIARGELLDSGACEHAAVCEACGAVVSDDAAVGRRLVSAVTTRNAASGVGIAHGDDSATETSLQAARRLLARDRGPLGALRARPVWQRLAVLLGLFGAGLAFMAGHSVHAPLEVVPHVAAFAAACILLMWPLGRPLPRLGRALAFGGSLALPLLFALWAHARATSPTPETSPWPCLALGAVLAAGLFALLSALDRRAARGAWQALLTGSISGMAASALLHLHCPSDALVHLTLGHAPLGVLAASMALALGLAGEPGRKAAR